MTSENTQLLSPKSGNMGMVLRTFAQIRQSRTSYVRNTLY